MTKKSGNLSNTLVAFLTMFFLNNLHILSIFGIVMTEFHFET